MALPETGGRKDAVVMVEFDPVGAAGTYTNWCGANSIRFEIANETKSQKVGDCDDWTAPVQELVNYSGQSVRMNVDASWTGATHAKTSDWALNQKKLKTRVHYPNALVGEVEYYDGTALLTGLTNDGIGNVEGDVISESVSLVFDGGVTPTAKA